jgi:uncharacterized iron-regulated membrane protein
MAWLHTWTGVFAGWILYFVFITGAATCFSVEIDRWMQPERPLLSPSVSQAQLLKAGFRRLGEDARDAKIWVVSGPSDRDPSRLQVLWREREGSENSRSATRTELLDPDGSPIDLTMVALGGAFALAAAVDSWSIKQNPEPP